MQICGELTLSFTLLLFLFFLPVRVLVFAWPFFCICRLESNRTISKSVRTAGRVVGKQPPLSARGGLFWPRLLLSAKGNVLVAVRSKISCFTCALLTKLTTLRLVVRLPYVGSIVLLSTCIVYSCMPISTIPDGQPLHEIPWTMRHFTKLLESNCTLTARKVSSIVVCLELRKEITARLGRRYHAAKDTPVYYIASQPRTATFFDQAQAYVPYT